jgi:hypothetical protein
MRQGIVLALVLALGVVVSAAAAGQQPRASCPNGYEMLAVPQDEDALRTLPRIAAGLDADPAPYTVDDLVALGNAIDENGDGQFCLKAVSNLNGNSVKAWAFFYGARDNDSAAG